VQDSGTGLSEATANTLYLRKTVPDTATANETFLADITCEGGIFVFDNITTVNAIVSLEGFPDDPTIQLTSGSLGTMTIKSNSLEVEASRPLNIGTNTNVDLNLGGTTTNIALGALTGAGATTLNKPLTPAYAYPVSVATQIGYILTGTNVSPFTYPTGGVLKQMGSIALTKGVWILTSNVNTGALAAQGYGINAISTTSASSTGNIGQQDTSGVNAYSVKSVLTLTYSTNVNITLYMNFQGSIASLITGLTFTATRIA
jgi:hypothetical protein